MFRYFKWLLNFRCTHENVRCLHGDEIIFLGWKRAECLDCKKLFEHLPDICSTTDNPHSTLNY